MNSDTSISLNSLLAAVASSDRSSFISLYQQTSPKLFALALRLTGRRDKAEEVLQDAFVSIWKRAADWDEARGQALTWMASIVRNRAIDILRKDNRAALFDTRLGHEAGLTFMVASTHELASEDVAHLHSCINELGANQRDTVLLAYFEGLTHEQLAERLNAPLGTVKSWLRRGLIQLRLCLER